MSQLPEQYDRIRREVIESALDGDATSNAGRLIDAVRDAVERCFALANKPVRELTDGEICLAFDGVKTPYRPSDEWLQKMRAVIDAHQRKQMEPETVTFRAARVIGEDSIAVLRADMLPCGWEWLPGEPQTIEVKLP